ncbi:hypothetical protein [Pseudomonas sp. O230]|uniref:hypothetical protein n=1 Tax=Pseudomonas sp. O230 TaxID=3159450 RepID=UPI00387B92D5
MTQQELIQHLRRQITFLRNSATAYDRGCAEEGIRIAVVIRVLCHDSGRCTSLLTHMGAKNNLQLVSTARTLPPTISAHSLPFGDLLGEMVLGETIHHASIPPASPTVLCPDWWRETVLVRNYEPYSRRDVVLTAAHKDGGAHVDKPDKRLEALREGFWVKVSKNDAGEEIRESMGDTHFWVLRRFADELLHSPGLLAFIT